MLLGQTLNSSINKKKFLYLHFFIPYMEQIIICSNLELLRLILELYFQDNTCLYVQTLDFNHKISTIKPLQ